jgi:hypothetical protein
MRVRTRIARTWITGSSARITRARITRTRVTGGTTIPRVTGGRIRAIASARH